MKSSNKNRIGLLTAIIVISFCLRPSITGLGSLLKLIKPDLGLSDTGAGFISTISMLAFALCSPFVIRLYERIKVKGALQLGFGLIIIGSLIRSYCGIPGIYLGTFIISSGISCGNVLIPAIVKSEFPEKYGLITAVTTTTMAVSSGVASGINYPIASSANVGWRNTLLIWALLALAAIFTSFAFGRIQIEQEQASSDKNIFRIPIAWWVTIFMGLICLLFYSCTSWLATIFQFKGLGATVSGYYVSAFQIMGIASSFLVPFWAGKKSGQKMVTFTVLGAFVIGILCMLCTSNPTILLIASLVSGFGCNGSFALAMSFIGFRTTNGADAAKLSSMSQSIGYIIAAFGPVGMGFVYELTGNWNVNLVLIIIILLLALIAGDKCARDVAV